jgi:carbamoyltransferase
VDGSARPQTVDPDANPRFARLIEAFYEQTGCPVLLNTSLNMRGEPIVCSPVDALICLVQAGLDALVIEDFLVERSMLPKNFDLLLSAWDTQPRYAFRENGSALEESLYTFV